MFIERVHDVCPITVAMQQAYDIGTVHPTGDMQWRLMIDAMCIRIGTHIE